MDPEIRQGLADGEQFAPDQQQVLASLQAGIKRRQFRRRTLLISAAAAAVAVVAVGAAVVLPVSSRQPPATPPSLPTAGSVANSPSTSAATASTPPLTTSQGALPRTPPAVTEEPPPTSVASTPSATAAVESRLPRRGTNESDIAYDLKLLLMAAGITDWTGDDNTGPSAEFYAIWQGHAVRVGHGLHVSPQLDAEHIDDLEIAGTAVQVVKVRFRGLSMRFSCPEYNYEVQAYEGTDTDDFGETDLERTTALTASLLEHLDCH